MKALTRRDLERLLTFVLGAYAVRDVTDFGRYAVRELSALVRAEWVSYDEMIPARRLSRNIFDPPEIVPPEAWTSLMHEHPMLAHYLQTGNGSARQIVDFMSQADFRNTALFNEVYRPTSVDNEITIALDIPLPSIVGFGLARTKKPFGDAERALLDLARPHLLRAYKNATTLSALRQQRTALLSRLTEKTRGVLIVTTDFRVESATPDALACIAAYACGPLHLGEPLSESLRRWATHSASIAANGVADAAFATRQPFIDERDSATLTVHFAGGSDDYALVVEECRAPGAVQSPALSAYRATFGLTPREREVLEWVRLGKTNNEIAQILRSSPRTVQKHLQNAFHKLGVENRTAAVSVLFLDGDADERRG
jgi:DNA-binding CsgD family transcriptional regulator